MKWREEKRSGTATEKGLFPVVREITVREAGTPEDAPLETIDLSDYCTSEVHAVDRAKFECRFRRLSTHQVKFKTTADHATFDLGKCFKLGLETLVYDQPQNGYIAQDGTITSWPEIADGTYTVIYWNGSGGSVEEKQLTVNSGKGDLDSGVFCVASVQERRRSTKSKACLLTRKATSMLRPSTGLNASGYSIISDGWNVDGNWSIDGEDKRYGQSNRAEP